VHNVVTINRTKEDDMGDDDRALAALGYKPVFKREFSMWSCFSFALSISGLYATIMATFIYPLYAGGAAAVVWSWLIGGAGALALALSIAEIMSAYPTSGAEARPFHRRCHTDTR
jgi:amino acid permease